MKKDRKLWEDGFHCVKYGTHVYWKWQKKKDGETEMEYFGGDRDEYLRYLERGTEKETIRG